MKLFQVTEDGLCVFHTENNGNMKCCVLYTTKYGNFWKTTHRNSKSPEKYLI